MSYSSDIFLNRKFTFFSTSLTTKQPTISASQTATEPPEGLV